jgi:hypothetical protein
MLLAATIDVADIGSAVIEALARRQLDQDLTGGIIFSAAGLASALVAVRERPVPRKRKGPVARALPGINLAVNPLRST